MMSDLSPGGRVSPRGQRPKTESQEVHRLRDENNDLRNCLKLFLEHSELESANIISSVIAWSEEKFRRKFAEMSLLRAPGTQVNDGLFRPISTAAAQSRSSKQVRPPKDPSVSSTTPPPSQIRMSDLVGPDTFDQSPVTLTAESSRHSQVVPPESSFRRPPSVHSSRKASPAFSHPASPQSNYYPDVPTQILHPPTPESMSYSSQQEHHMIVSRPSTPRSVGHYSEHGERPPTPGSVGHPDEYDGRPLTPRSFGQSDDNGVWPPSHRSVDRPDDYNEQLSTSRSTGYSSEHGERPPTPRSVDLSREHDQQRQTSRSPTPRLSGHSQLGKKRKSSRSPTPRLSGHSQHGEKRKSSRSPTPKLSGHSQHGHQRKSSRSPTPKLSGHSQHGEKRKSFHSPTPKSSGHSQQGQQRQSSPSPTPRSSDHFQNGNLQTSSRSPTPKFSGHSQQGEPRKSSRSPTPTFSGHSHHSEQRKHSRPPTPQSSGHTGYGEHTHSSRPPTPGSQGYSSHHSEHLSMSRPPTPLSSSYFEYSEHMQMSHLPTTKSTDYPEYVESMYKSPSPKHMHQGPAGKGVRPGPKTPSPQPSLIKPEPRKGHSRSTARNESVHSASNYSAGNVSTYAGPITLQFHPNIGQFTVKLPTDSDVENAYEKSKNVLSESKIQRELHRPESSAFTPRADLFADMHPQTPSPSTMEHGQSVHSTEFAHPDYVDQLESPKHDKEFAPFPEQGVHRPDSRSQRVRVPTPYPEMTLKMQAGMSGISEEGEQDFGNMVYNGPSPADHAYHEYSFERPQASSTPKKGKRGPTGKHVPPKKLDKRPRSPKAQNLSLVSEERHYSQNRSSSTSKKASHRILGEIAFQLERRILDYIFARKKTADDSEEHRRRRFYGYTVSNIPEMIYKESLRYDGVADESTEFQLNYRLKYISTSLAPFGYNMVKHGAFSQEMINKYGLLSTAPDRKTLESFGLADTVTLREFVSELSWNEAERRDMLILLECLFVLAHDDGRAIFLW